MAKVLVTGGAGFLGSHIADALSDGGHAVTVFDKNVSAWLRTGQRMLVGDINDTGLLAEAVAGQDFVYHLAAFADLNAAKSRPLDTVAVNIMGTVNLLNACMNAGIQRFIFGSTVYVYSREGGFYRCSKQACENYVEEFHARYGLPYSILRYGSLYGPRTDMANGVFRLLHRYMHEDKIVYPGASSDKRDYIHSFDAARLSAQIIAGEQYANRHYTITGNDRLSISELFTMFSEILDRHIEVVYEGDLNNPSGHYNITPYAFTPKLGNKLVSNEYVDMGQGLINIIEHIHHENLINSEHAFQSGHI